MNMNQEELTVDKYKAIIERFMATKQLGEDMFYLLYLYYKEVNPPEKQLITTFDEFVYYFQLWINMPVSIGNTPDQLMMNIRPQTFNKGINNCITHFNKHFNI